VDLHAEIGDGGQPSAFLKLGVGAREEAMGRMATLAPNDAYAFAYNPALLAGLTSVSIGSEFASMADYADLDYASVARPVDVSGQRYYYGLAYTHFGLNQPIEVRATNSPNPDSLISDSQYDVLLSAAGWLKGSPLALGLNLRLINEALGTATANGFSGDLGVLFRALPWLDADAVLQDVGGRMGWSTGVTESFPFSFRAGAIANFLDQDLDFGLEFEKSSEQDLRFRAGGEGWIAKILALRAGFDGSRLTWGIGAKARPWGVGMQVDYAMAFSPVLEGALTQQFSLTFDFPMAPWSPAP
jgi:hypothetical protein